MLFDYEQLCLCHDYLANYKFFGLLGIQLEPKLKQVSKLFIQLNQSRFASCLSQKRKVFEVYLSWRRPEKAPK